MVLGTLAAIIHGAGLPLMMLVFGDMTDSFAGAGNLGNITFSNTTNTSKCCLWYWFFLKAWWKVIDSQWGLWSPLQVCTNMFSAAGGGGVWAMVHLNEFEKMIFTVIRTYSGSAGRDRWEKRALWSQKYPGRFKKRYWNLIWCLNSKWESVMQFPDISVMGTRGRNPRWF